MSNTHAIDPTRAPDPFDARVLDASSEQRSNIFESRLALLYAALTTRLPGRALSIGAGSGSFEEQLRRRFGLRVATVVEPSPHLAAAARGRGLEVVQARAQDLHLDDASYDTIYYHGSSFGFIPDNELESVFAADLRALRPGGRLVLTDVPKESPLGILLLTLQKFPDVDQSVYADLIEGTAFYNYHAHPYKPYWHRTDYYIALLRRLGFTNLAFKQTVLANPPYQNARVEAPIEGYDRGNYVAVIAQKPDDQKPAGQQTAEGNAR